MFKFLKWIFGLFSPYATSVEREVDRFFKNIKSTDSISNIRQELLNLMQENLIVVNIWMEKKYKGYTYLSKSVRREMYENSAKIVRLFLAHCGSFAPTDTDVKRMLDEKGLVFPNGGNEMIRYLLQIMMFLHPSEKYYHYIKTASFGKLLRDPEKTKLEGDCNQIVTLYAYLFSLKFPIDELKIKLLPEHVCLHFRGVDIEATNGTFQKYKDSEQILPVTEILSTNLLDIADFREELQVISARDFVKSAQLAYAISSLKPLVAKNLNSAYYNLGVAAMNSNDFETAIFYLSKTDDSGALKIAYRNGAVYYLKQNNFEKASYYAGLSGDSEIIKTVKKNELVYRYNQLAKKVSGVKTLADAKKYKSTYQEMLRFAQQMGDGNLASGVEETLRKI